MPLLNSITTPYAEAFLQVADGRNETDEIVDQARQVLALWQESPELREAMASPILEVDAKKAALGALFADQLTPSFLNLLKLLADRQRIGFQVHVRFADRGIRDVFGEVRAAVGFGVGGPHQKVLLDVIGQVQARVVAVVAATRKSGALLQDESKFLH